jgi:ABC-type multidrug transport system ATPase subunit
VPDDLPADWSELSQVLESVDASDLTITAINAQERSHRVTAKLPEQQQVDEIVDRLRAAGISIVRLEVKRPTLEDTFMKLVGPAEADS